jgi:hypothetical protein
MLRAWSSWMVCGLMLCGSIASAQDSGPGPIEATGSQQYEVTVLKIGSMQTGTFDFALTTAEPGTTTPAVASTGTFTSTLGTTTATGTWYAVDVGSYALWVATVEGTTGSQVITGFATPEMIAGRIVTQSTASTGRGRLLRALFNTSIFYGTAVEAPETPEDPTME